MASRANQKTLYSSIHLTNTYYDTLTNDGIIRICTTNGSTTYMCLGTTMHTECVQVCLEGYWLSSAAWTH